MRKPIKIKIVHTPLRKEICEPKEVRKLESDYEELEKKFELAIVLIQYCIGRIEENGEGTYGIRETLKDDLLKGGLE